ncbi:MAG: hypothetical protein DLM58_20845 [Pseudonocardiales bacterium]|nr:MAG: hypothetical protein DLM58_20845 [Pseudonocardiales bacterium]
MSLDLPHSLALGGISLATRAFGAARRLFALGVPPLVGELIALGSPLSLIALGSPRTVVGTLIEVGS